jgi:hypothetical protein
MTGFKVLLLKEHYAYDNKRLDCRIIILYDSSEESFFYYGSRNTNIDTKQYDLFSGSYHYSQTDGFLTFLSYYMNHFYEVITSELYYIDIYESEYSKLNFNVLMRKMSNRSLLAAYDEQIETKDSIGQYLEML